MSIQSPHALSNAGRRATRTTSTTHSTDEILHLLSNSRRRHTIEYLSTHNASEFDEIVDAVAARETEKPVCDVTGKERKRVYSSLRQSHLDQLKDAGVIEFEEKGGIIEPGREFDVFVEYLARLDGDRGFLSSAVDRFGQVVSALAI